MLLAAVIRIVPVESTTAPAVLGRAIHGWLLGRLAEVEAALTQSLHEGSELRPFTVSDLRGTGRAHGGRVSLDPDHVCWIRVTSLTKEMTAALKRALPTAGERLELGGAKFAVQATTTDPLESPWAGRATYPELVQRYTLAPEDPPRSVTLRFTSPTLFRSQGHDTPLPQASLVFGSYLQRWNAFANLTLPQEARRYAEECVALGRFRLRSHLVSFEDAHKGAHVGYTGQVRFRFLVGDTYWTRLMKLLAGYAFWCGTGYRTTVGLGQTHAIEEGRDGGRHPQSRGRQPGHAGDVRPVPARRSVQGACLGG